MTGEPFLVKLRRFLPLTFKTIVPRMVVDAESYVRLPAGMHATNPSIVALDDGYLLSVRGVNHEIVRDTVGDSIRFVTGDRYRTVNRFALLDRAFERVRELPELGAAFDDLEDLRLFRFGDAVMALATMADPQRGPDARTMALLTIDAALTTGTIAPLASPYGFKQEKNWAPFVLAGELHFVYSFDPLVILRYDAASGRTAFAAQKFADVPKAALRYFDAGSSAGLPVDGGFCFATHRRKLSLPLRHRFYLTRMCVLDAKDFSLACGPYFSIGRPSIQFVNGVADAGDDLAVTFGLMDASGHLSRVRKRDAFTGTRLA